MSEAVALPDRETSIQEGYLRKRGQYDLRWKKRFFSVIDNVLYYYKSEQVRSTRVNKGTYHMFQVKAPLGSIPLQGALLVPEEKDFVIQITSGARVIYVSASTKVEQTVWLQTLRSKTNK